MLYIVRRQKLHNAIYWVVSDIGLERQREIEHYPEEVDSFLFSKLNYTLKKKKR